MTGDTEADTESQGVRELTEALAEDFGEDPEEIERDASNFDIEDPSEADAEYVISSEE